MTQSELAGSRYSHAYVSVLESGRREASRAALEYFATRLGVSVEALSKEKGVAWALQMAQDLRSEGRDGAGRELLEKTLDNLADAGEIHPRVGVALHLELGHLAHAEQERAERHFRKVLAMAGDEESLSVERAEALAALAELQAADGQVDDALDSFRTSTTLLLERVRRVYA